MKLYLTAFCLIFAVRSATASDNYHCYHWSAEDVEEMGPGKGMPSVEAPVCESYVGNVFTQGNNDDYPNCGDCWCCQPEGYKCYQWTDEDYAAFGSSPTVDQEKEQCESYTDFKFQGDSETYPYCGGCWCCQPVYECYFWTDEDKEIFGSTPTPEQERARCEDDLGYIFTQGINDDFPGTGGCWCIKPRA